MQWRGAWEATLRPHLPEDLATAVGKILSIKFRATRSQARVSAYQGAGGQENADRNTGTDHPASVGAWLTCFENTGIYESYETG